MAAGIVADDRRGQVTFVGSSGSGKSSLYQCLKHPNPYVIDVPSCSVLVEDWKPFDPENGQVAEECRKYVDGDFTEEDVNASIHVWDICGQESLWTAQQLCMAKDMLFVLVTNVRNPLDAKAVPQWVQMIQAKFMGANIILVASNCEVYDGDGEDIVKKVKKLENKIVTEIQDEITSLKELNCELLVKNRIERLRTILEKRPKIHPKVFMTSAVTGKGMSDLRCAILKHVFAGRDREGERNVLSANEQILLSKMGSISCHSGKSMVVSVEDYGKMGSALDLEPRDLECATNALEMKGYVARVDVPSASYHDTHTTLMITDPCCFATAMVMLHRDEENPQDFVNKFQKSQLVERFWPTSTRPNDWTLRTAVEDIVNKGLIRESFLPLCWQVWDMEEDDIRNVVPAMTKLGVLVEGAPKAGYDVELALSYFKNLSVTKRYYLPQLMKLSKDTPDSVWSQGCPASTIQVGLRYKFRGCVNNGLIYSVIAVCKCSKPNTTVLAYWQSGLVARIGNTDIRIMWHNDALNFDARYKVADGERRALNMAWVTLAHYLHVTEIFLSNFPGLYYQLVSPLNGFKTPKSVYEYIHECSERPEVPLKALWVLPPLDVAVNNNDNLSIARWMRDLLGYCRIKMFGSSIDDMAKLASSLEHFGFDVTQPSDKGKIDEGKFYSIAIFFLTQSYADDPCSQEDLKKAQNLTKNIIAVCFNLDNTPDLKDVIWHDLNSVPRDGSTRIFDSDHLDSLINRCCALAYGSGPVEPFDNETSAENTPSVAVNHNMEPVTEGAPADDRVERRPEKKRVQFSDSEKNQQLQPNDDIEGQVKPLAASTVAAAMVGAANEHLTRTKKVQSLSAYLEASGPPERQMATKTTSTTGGGGGGGLETTNKRRRRHGKTKICTVL